MTATRFGSLGSAGRTDPAEQEPAAREVRGGIGVRIAAPLTPAPAGR